MALTPGTRLGPYEITSALGAGGMGEVYRARDSRLQRDVAIKVLPGHLSQNPDLRTRFEREARAVAALNHPHICVIYDVGREGDVDYLVMELVEGETLHDRLVKGALPNELTLKLAVEIAGALDRAHRAGIIHRDLKPGNVMLTKSGAKLMDFGLARGAAVVGGSGDVTQTPSMTRPLTAQGSIVGTLQYMAPEQLEGKEADARADLWALGCVLYEMATGKRAFEGATAASVISAIMRDEPRAMAELSPLTPPALERVVKRCLAKDPDDRWQTARDLMHELGWIAKEGSSAGSLGGAAVSRSSSATHPSIARRRLHPSWILSGVLGIAMFAALAMLLSRRELTPAVTRFEIAANPALKWMEWPAISPDGRMLAFQAEDSTSTTRIWLRRLDDWVETPLAGTEDARRPFWSPDSRQLAFFTALQLKKIATAGGSPQVICDVRGGSDGAWSPEDVILFDGGQGDSICRVSASGGPITGATTLDRTKERLNGWPWFLPDGKHFLFLSNAIKRSEVELCVGMLDSPDVKRLGRVESRATYTDPGLVFFTLEGSLVARPFDPWRLEFTGEPIPIAGKVEGGATLLSHFSVSSAGVLAYLPERPPNRTSLLWVDRSGNDLHGSCPPSALTSFALSPDGTRIAYDILDAALTSVDVWAWDLRRSIATRLTFDGDVDEGQPIWSPDGTRIAFSANPQGPLSIMVLPANGGTATALYQDAHNVIPEDWTRDGRWISYSFYNDSSSDARAVSLDDPGHPVDIAASDFAEENPMFSPDGKWVVFLSDESGRNEIYVQSFPESHGKVRISTEGGEQASWSTDGKQIYFVGSSGELVAVPVSTGETIDIGTPATLFRRNLLREGFERNRYAATADGQRFLISIASQNQIQQPFRVVMSWTEELKRAEKR